MKIKTLDYSLYDMYTKGAITLHEAARAFHSQGWTNFVDEDYTKRVFNRIACEL